MCVCVAQQAYMIHTYQLAARNKHYTHTPDVTAVKPSGVSRQPYHVCCVRIILPASYSVLVGIYMVLCSECAQRATKCLQCRRVNASALYSMCTSYIVAL